MSLGNYIIKKTSWYNSFFSDCQKFWNGVPYGLQIANVGSNSGKYSFDFSNNSLKGFNFAMSPQTFVMDKAMINFFSDHFTSKAKIIIPICPFSSIVGYSYPINPKRYYTILSKDYIPNYNHGECNRITDIKENPLDFFSIHYILKQILLALKISIRSTISKKWNQTEQFKIDAITWEKNWMKEFSISNLENPLSPENKRSRNEAVEILKDLICTIQDKGLDPILIIPPIHKSLSNCFSDNMREVYINSYIYPIIEKQHVIFLNYMDDELFSNNIHLFSNSYLLNKAGAKLFTKRVLADLSNMSI